ncbi:hypothetical protein BJ741DRAFT_645706 [Chytriomyces cf. hyalinus JEL632]|nr:hypothetical protein BJ741DRAFT_645706 [Chytriomyces cf. hyalinus JEL632]
MRRLLVHLDQDPQHWKSPCVKHSSSSPKKKGRKVQKTQMDLHQESIGSFSMVSDNYTLQHPSIFQNPAIDIQLNALPEQLRLANPDEMWGTSKSLSQSSTLQKLCQQNVLKNSGYMVKEPNVQPLAQAIKGMYE